MPVSTDMCLVELVLIRALDIQLPSSFIAMTLLAHLIGFTIFGTLLAFRYAYSVIRLLLEISVIPGTNVGSPSRP